MSNTTVQILTAEDFPPAVSPIWENLEGDEQMREAATLAAIIAYCGLTQRLRVRYAYDNPDKLTMLLLNLLVIGHSGIGKGIIRDVLTMILKDLIELDKKDRRKLQEYSELPKKEKDKTPEPKVVIRFLQSFTLPVAVKYADFAYRRYGDWLPFFLYGDELGAFVKNRRNNDDFQAVARNAYDIGMTYQKDTLYKDGYNAAVDINWNSVLCGQELALRKYITEEGVVLGDANRHILIKLSNRLGEVPASMRQLSEEQKQVISTTCARLMAETYTADDQLMPVHVVNMDWMDETVFGWCDQIRDTVTKSGSNAMDSFYIRASKSAHRIATMLYHLWGEDNPEQLGISVTQEEVRDKVRRCYLYYAQLILDSGMAQWGKTYETCLPKDDETPVQKQTLYDMMPKRFTRNQLRDKVEKEGLGTKPRSFIFKWLKKKLIYEVKPDVYEKLY